MRYYWLKFLKASEKYSQKICSWSYKFRYYSLALMDLGFEMGLELLLDIGMLYVYENGIRGGITKAFKHHADVNNKYINNFDLLKSFLLFYVPLF